MASLHRTLAVAALLVATSRAAGAAELFTSASQASIGGRIVCAIVNVGASPIVVSAMVRAFSSGTDITYTNLCPTSPATLAPGMGCVAGSETVGFHAAYCHFKSSSSRVRANLIVYDGTDVVHTVPATK